MYKLKLGWHLTAFRKLAAKRHKKNARNNKENMMKRQNKIKISRNCYFFNENVCIVSSGVFFAYKVNVNIEIPAISAQMPT